MGSKSACTLALLAATAGAPGCTDSTAPPTPVPPLAVSQAKVVAGEMTPWSALAIAVTDAQKRLLPALGDASVGAALGSLATAIEKADAAALPSLIDATGQALDRYAQGAGAARVADVDAIRLTLDAARAVVGRTSP